MNYYERRAKLQQAFYTEIQQAEEALRRALRDYEDAKHKLALRQAEALRLPMLQDVTLASTELLVAMTAEYRIPVSDELLVDTEAAV